MSNSVSNEQVLDVLGKVQDPELHQDLVSLGMIKDLVINGANVKFTLELTTPACPMRDQIKSNAIDAVKALPGVTNVEINLTANVPTDGRARGNIQRPIRNAIAIASGKGGVGKSTVAVNISVALANVGAKVGLLDADIYGPNVPTMMGVNQLPPAKNEKLIPAEAHGIKLMSIGFLVPEGQPLIWRGPMLHSAIRQFITNVEWGELDYLIIDLPPGTGDAQLSLAQSIPLSGGVIVTLPQKVSLEDARRGLEMFRSMNVPILGVVENMSFLTLPDGSHLDVFGQGGGEQLAAETNADFMGSVPMDPVIRESGDAGIPIVISHPSSEAAKALNDVAEKVAAKVSVIAREGSNIIPIEMID
jgi:ATP-binding protein involved in chromosome partitioning